MTGARATARAGWVLALLLAGPLAGCAAFVTKQEYADYRAVRLSPSDDARLLAMQRYVAGHPQGRWAVQVQAERSAREREVFERGKDSRPGLELYLAAYPEGGFAAQAQARLSAIALIEQRKRAEAAHAAALELERKRLEEERSRTWVTRFVGYWTRTLLGVARWGVPIEQVARENPELSRAFGRPPRPRCSFDECVKYYDSAFAVPVPGGTRLERTMRLLLRLRLREGKLERAELLLPLWGFSRWIELEDRKLVLDADPTARAAAVEAAFARILPVLDEVAKDRVAIEGFALGELAAPAIGPSGERLDTTAVDPAAPPNVIQGAAGEGATAAAGAEPDPAQLMTPQAPEAAPDMELAPLQVTPDGRAAPAGGEMVLDPLRVPAQGAASGEMVLDPLAVPAQGGGAASATPGATQPAAAQPTAPLLTPATTRAFRAGALRVIVFAAGTDASAPAYDAIVIEPEPPAPAKGKGRKAAGAAPAPRPAPATAKRAAPAASPAPAPKPASP